MSISSSNPPPITDAGGGWGNPPTAGVPVAPTEVLARSLLCFALPVAVRAAGHEAGGGGTPCIDLVVSLSASFVCAKSFTLVTPFIVDVLRHLQSLARSTGRDAAR